MSQHDGGYVLHATSLTGRTRWEHRLRDWPPHSLLVQADRVIVNDGAVLRAFDADGDPAWTVDLHEVGTAWDPYGVRLDAIETCEVQSPLIGLPGGDILVAIWGDMIGYLVVEPEQGDVRMLPAHLPPRGLTVPLPDGEREFLVLQGWPEDVNSYAMLPTVTVVDVGTGAEVLRHVVPESPHAMIAGSAGLVAVAGCPTSERWAKYHHWPSYNLEDCCYVLFLDKSGVRGEWRPGSPFGLLAAGADGDLLIRVGDELVSVE